MMSGTGPGVPPLFVYRFKSNPPALGGRLLKKGRLLGSLTKQPEINMPSETLYPQCGIQKRRNMRGSTEFM